MGTKLDSALNTGQCFSRAEWSANRYWHFSLTSVIRTPPVTAKKDITEDKGGRFKVPFHAISSQFWSFSILSILCFCDWAFLFFSLLSISSIVNRRSDFILLIGTIGTMVRDRTDEGKLDQIWLKVDLSNPGSNPGITFCLLFFFSFCPVGERGQLAWIEFTTFLDRKVSLSEVWSVFESSVIGIDIQVNLG